MINKLRNFVLAGLLISMAGPAFAQPAVTLEAFGGWLWTGRAGYNGSIIVDDKSNYGVRFGVSPASELLVEFEWNHTDTRISYSTLSGPVAEDVALNYYMLGINKQLMEGPAVPFGLLNLGVMNLKATSTDFVANYFTVGLGGGLKYYLSDRIGLRLQARLMFPMQWGGFGVGCGTGGCGGGVSTYSSVIQGDFTGGVILKFGG